MNAIRTVVAVLLASVAFVHASGHTHSDGLIIRYEMGLIYIDVGQRNGVMKGDLYDIVASEVISHPLTGDTLAVTPKSVGALQVHQVLDKMSIAKVVQLEPGDDPVLKSIVKVNNPERLAEIEHFVKRNMFYSMRRQVDLLPNGLIPGVYQMGIEEIRKGRLLFGVHLASLVGGVAYRVYGNDFLDQYNNLPAGTLDKTFDHYYNKASDHRKMSNQLFWLSGAMYIYNWVDILWMGDSANVRIQPSLDLGVKPNFSGNPMLSIMHRF